MRFLEVKDLNARSGRVGRTHDGGAKSFPRPRKYSSVATALLRPILDVNHEIPATRPSKRLQVVHPAWPDCRRVGGASRIPGDHEEEPGQTAEQAAVVFVVIVAVAQLIRPERANPPTDVSGTIQARVGTASGQVAVLDRSCRDCHSNGTPAVVHPSRDRVRQSRVGRRSQGALTTPTCPRDCPCEAPRPRLQSQREPTGLISEVEETEGFARKSKMPERRFFRLANHRLQPPHRGEKPKYKTRFGLRPEIVPASLEDWRRTATVYAPGALVGVQRFFSATAMPATDWRTPLCSHEPASTSLATRALKTPDDGPI